MLDLKMIWLFIAVFFVEIFVVTILISDVWLNHVISQETHMVREFMGYDTAHKIENRAQVTYRYAFVESGMKSAVVSFLVPELGENANVLKAAPGYRTFIAQRIDAVFNMLYHTITRFFLMLSWLPMMFLVGVPAIIDGIIQWKKRQHSFRFANPTFHRGALWGLLLLVMGTALLLFFPAPFNPIIIPCIIFIMCIAMSVIAANSQKRM